MSWVSSLVKALTIFPLRMLEGTGVRKPLSTFGELNVPLDKVKSEHTPDFVVAIDNVSNFRDGKRSSGIMLDVRALLAVGCIGASRTAMIGGAIERDTHAFLVGQRTALIARIEFAIHLGLQDALLD